MADALIMAVSAALDRAEAERLLVRPGVDPDAIAEAETSAGRRMPPALRQVFSRSDGIEFDSVDIIDLSDFVVFNELPERFDELPGAVIFGSDRGDGVYLLDPENALGEGSDAVYFAFLDSLAADRSRLAAPDLARFIESSIDGDILWQGPDLRTRSLERLLATIAAHPDAVRLKEPLDVLERIRPSLGLAKHAPILSEFYEHSDGIEIPAADLVIGGMADISAIASSYDGNGRPGCLHVGTVGSLEAYVSTGGGWRGLPPDRLMLAEDDVALQDAAPLGRVSDVLRAFIENG